MSGAVSLAVAADRLGLTWRQALKLVKRARRGDPDGLRAEVDRQYPIHLLVPVGEIERLEMRRASEKSAAPRNVAGKVN